MPRRPTGPSLAPAHVVARKFHVGRVTGVPMEPRAALGHYDSASGRYTLYAGSGGAVRQKNELASVLGIAPDTLRVLSHDVGGNFGTRNRVFVEFGLVLWASRKLGRPVKFTATRSEAFLSDYQGRDLVTAVELALDKNGRFLALRATNISNVGARCVSLSPLSKGAGLIPGSYAIPAATLRAMAVYTNTMPTQAYRSSGRPEVTFAIERLVDAAAEELGIDRIALRRKNLVRPKDMPYRNAVGMLYDSGRYEENMDWAMELAEWNSSRRAGARRRGAAGCWASGLRTMSSLRSARRASRRASRCGRKAASMSSSARSRAGRAMRPVSPRWSPTCSTCRPRACASFSATPTLCSVGGGSHSGRSMRHAATVFSKAAVELIARGKAVAAVDHGHGGGEHCVR